MATKKPTKPRIRLTLDPASLTARVSTIQAIVPTVRAAVGAVLTVDERLASLELRQAISEANIADLALQMARVRTFTDLMKLVVSRDGLVPGIMFLSRVGILTEFWMLQPFGFGAALSVGTAGDRFAGYFEVDKVTCPDFPSVALYASVTAPNPYGQKNIALEGVATNAPDLQGISQNYGLALTLGDRQFLVHRQAIQLAGGDASAFKIGRTTADARNLWAPK